MPARGLGLLSTTIVSDIKANAGPQAIIASGGLRFHDATGISALCRSVLPTLRPHHHLLLIPHQTHLPSWMMQFKRIVRWCNDPSCSTAAPGSAITDRFFSRCSVGATRSHHRSDARPP